MLHKMNLQNSPFEAIKSGTKTIEMRLYDEKRKLINTGDEIEFTNVLTGEKLMVNVIKLHLYKDFKELYEAFDKVSIGYKEHELSDPKDMEIYYSKEDIKKYGTVGIEIKLK